MKNELLFDNNQFVLRIAHLLFCHGRELTKTVATLDSFNDVFSVRCSKDQVAGGLINSQQVVRGQDADVLHRRFLSAGNIGRNADELFRRLQASQFVAAHGDEVCPAKWQPGAETLKPSLDLVGML